MSDKRRNVLREIAKDAKADTRRYDGMPFKGSTLAMITGEQNAMIVALANIMETLLPENNDG